MSERVKVTVEGGRAVAVKVAVTEVEAERLAVEAEWLERASHPGVIQLIGFERTDHGAELRTGFAGRPLTVSSPLAVEQIAGVMASIAATVADLHELGIVHTRIGPSHVLVGAAGQPRLCGFSGASAISDAATRAEDVASLGRLIHELIEAERSITIPERRWRALTVRRRDHDRHSLLAVADRAIDEAPSRRPTARALSDAILAAVPRAVLAPSDEPQHQPTSSSPAHRRRRSHHTRGRVAGAVLVALGVVAVAGRALARPAADRPPISPTSGATVVEPPRPTAPTSSTELSPTVLSPPVDTTAPCRSTGASIVSFGSDGCPDHVLRDPPLIELDGTRYSVGRAGDRVALGDWDCDGVGTPALLRPDTGEVFVFDRWAERSAEVDARAITRVPGASSLAAVPDGGCDALDVASAGGTVRVDVPRTSGP
jgi:hypothetical protein